MTAFCKKCRGEGEYQDYDSEAEEEEIRYEETHCEACENRKVKKDQKRKKIRQLL